MLSNHFNITFSTKRLTEVDDDKQEFQDNLANQEGMLQPRGDEFTGEQELAKDLLFTSRIDIQETDKIIIGSDEYIVATIHDHNYGNSPHYKILLTKE